MGVGWVLGGFWVRLGWSFPTSSRQMAEEVLRGGGGGGVGEVPGFEGMEGLAQAIELGESY